MELGARFETFFLSDLHLGACYFANPRERERHVVAFLQSIRHRARAIYLLGDILDYWYEYRYVVPRGFVRLFGKLAELSDEGVKITWIIGNHDIWIFDYLPTELGVRVVDGNVCESIDGVEFFLAHGDRVWQSSRGFRFIAKLFRNRVCQRLFASIHPRWTVPFAFKWSGSNRCSKAELESEPERANAAVQHLKDFCVEYSALHPDIKYYIFGHLHLPVFESVGNSSEIVILGDWIRHYTYAVYDGVELKMERYLLQG